MKKSVFLAAASFFFSLNAAVAQPYTKGLGLEAGGGYSQLFWRAGGLNGDRLAFSLSPTARAYFYTRSPRWGIQVFTGWNRFGGKRGTEPNGYHDAIWIKAWESGLFCLRHLGPNRFGLGIKYNYHLKAYGEYYGSLSMPPGTEPVKMIEDWSSEFSKVSLDMGIRYGRRWRRMTASSEAWFGMTNLAGGVFEDIGATIRQCHYRVLVGVEF